MNLFTETKSIFQILNIFASQHSYSREPKYIRITQHEHRLVFLTANNNEICRIELDRGVFYNLDSIIFNKEDNLGDEAFPSVKYLTITNALVYQIRKACDESDTTLLKDILQSNFTYTNPNKSYFKHIELFIKGTVRFKNRNAQIKSLSLERVAKANRLLNKSKEKFIFSNIATKVNKETYDTLHCNCGINGIEIDVYVYEKN
jgi:hypothetical protein